jgi:hypothetical protein
MRTGRYTITSDGNEIDYVNIYEPGEDVNDDSWGCIYDIEEPQSDRNYETIAYYLYHEIPDLRRLLWE